MIGQNGMIANDAADAPTAELRGDDPDDGQRPHRYLQYVGLTAAKIADERPDDIACPRSLQVNQPYCGMDLIDQLAPFLDDQQIDVVPPVRQGSDQRDRDPFRAAAREVGNEESNLRHDR